MRLSSLLLNMHMAYEEFVIWLIEHWRKAFVAVLFFFLMIGSFFAWKSYQLVCQSRAHKVYLDVVRVVNAEVKSGKKADGRLTFPSSQEKNEAVVALGDLFLGQHKSTSFAPAVLGFVSHALSGLGKNDDARERMHAAAKACSSTDLQHVYVISAALMDVDAQDAFVQERGVGALKNLAKNTSSSSCDAALYYLGEFYWSKQNYQEARLWWAQLLSVADKKVTSVGTEIRSPWVLAAREKLALIDYR